MNPSRLPRDLDDMLAQRHYSRPVWKWELGAVVMGLFMAALVIIWAAYLVGCASPSTPGCPEASVPPPMAAAPAGRPILVRNPGVIFPGSVFPAPDGGRR